jgi:transcriptional antiterminator RfaH
MRQWYVLRSKPKKESSAAQLLQSWGIEVYYPQAMVHKPQGKPAALEPLFPGYLFGRLDPLTAEIGQANRTAGILYVLGYGDDPWPVPDDLILSIKNRLARTGGVRTPVSFRPGDRVVITNGPMQGIEAIFDGQLSPNGRVRVLIQILKRLCRAEVHLSQLRSA